MFGIGVARRSSGLTPGILLAISTRGSTFAAGCCAVTCCEDDAFAAAVCACAAAYGSAALTKLNRNTAVADLGVMRFKSNASYALGQRVRACRLSTARM